MGRLGLLLILTLVLGLGMPAACSDSTPVPTPTTSIVVSATSVPRTVVPTATATPAPANIVFILTDDLDSDSIRYMPKLKSLLTDRGTMFSNFFVNVSLCCPSRINILCGQYSHNTKIYSNTPPTGGFERVLELGLEKDTFATALRSAGYRTMLAGKYLNGYPLSGQETYVPPGWDEWYSAAKGNAYGEFNYTLNENGKLVAYGNKADDYGTDVYGRKTDDFIKRSTAAGKPFMAYVAVYAPHSPATPAPRHAGLFADAKAPRSASFNEADVRDKPQFVRSRPLLTAANIADIDEQYRKRLQSLQAVDDLIENVVKALETAGQLDRTYIVFSSDNGFHMGQHRLQPGKLTAYEEDVRVPLIVRGPGVPAGRGVGLLAGNTDLAPTFVEIAGAKASEKYDGRSLLPLFRGDAVQTSQWRQAYLLEHTRERPVAGPRATVAAVRTADPGVLEPADPDDEQELALGNQQAARLYVGIRTSDFTYVEYESGERELYDLARDPGQLVDIANQQPQLARQLSALLQQLARCAGPTCRAAENALLAADGSP